MLGCWIRPWRGEALVGQVMAVSGDELVCRSAGGFQFIIRLADLKRWMFERTPRQQFLLPPAMKTQAGTALPWALS